MGGKTQARTQTSMGASTSAREDPDGDLISRMAAGEPRALRLLMDRHLTRVHAIAYRMLGNVADAEDVSQEAFLKAWRQAGKWQSGRARFSTWLIRVAMNGATDRLRKKPFTDLADIEEPVDPGRRPDQSLEDSELRERVSIALGQLPDRQRAALVLNHYEGYGNPEIAEVMEVSVEAVESLLARARRALKSALAGEIALLKGDH